MVFVTCYDASFEIHGAGIHVNFCYMEYEIIDTVDLMMRRVNSFIPR